MFPSSALIQYGFPNLAISPSIFLTPEVLNREGIRRNIAGARKEMMKEKTAQSIVEGIHDSYIHRDFSTLRCVFEIRITTFPDVLRYLSPFSGATA